MRRFLEADYKAIFELPNGAGDGPVKAKKTSEGWVKQINKRFWVPVNKEVKVVEKKPILSPIAQVSSGGYTQKDNFSRASIEWLKYQMELARQRGDVLVIQHALNGGEDTIFGTNYKVDGRAVNTVYEYHVSVYTVYAAIYKIVLFRRHFLLHSLYFY